MSKEYMVVCQQLYTTGDPNNAFATSYDCDNKRFDTLKDAIRHGFVIRDSDDFNIAVVDGNTLLSWDWMSETIDEDEDTMTEIAEKLGLKFVSTNKSNREK